MSGNIDINKALKVASKAALEAGQIQKDYRFKSFTVEHKGETDLVTEVDIACEKAIIDIIKVAFPDHGILAEEEDFKKGESRYTWVIDPLDGTTNYAHGFPVYCASVGLEMDGQSLVGAVCDPTRDELFTAAKGHGAYLNDVPIKVSSTEKLIDGLLATGFPYSIKTNPQNNLKQFGNFAMRAQALRRPGAAALDLCYVACGRLDGFWEFHLKPWDIAAGTLMVTEAGGRMTHTDGAKLDIYRSDIVASNGPLHEAMLEILKAG
ncbi:Inositol-1-monophosphatase [hydrothermal vent metagenome]|uniref:inositol-phosphate phosphatase n=1 Tax=hydrothermal vent metagenome TaxID=652676 RepID=A0A3B1BTG0_9ZZZZ